MFSGIHKNIGSFLRFLSLRNPHAFTTTAVVCGILFLKAGIVIKNGFINGRLSMPLAYDDVSYFSEALILNAVFAEKGFVNGLMWIAQHLPHSPFSTFGASISLFVSNNAIWAPYFFTAVAIACALSVFVAALRLSIAETVFFSVYFVSLPWYDAAVALYQPDLLSGLFCAVNVYILLLVGLRGHCRVKVLFWGVFAGASLLIKPTAIPMFVVLLVPAFCVSVYGVKVADHLRGDGQGPAHVFMYIAGVVLASCWYYIPRLQAVLDYITAALGVQSYLWTVKMSFLESTAYYISFLYAYSGPSLIVLLVAVGLSWWGLFRSGIRGYSRIVLLTVVALILVAYIIPTATAVKAPIYGSFFYSLIFLLPYTIPLFLRDTGSYQEYPRLVAATYILMCGLVVIGIKDNQARVHETVAQAYGNFFNELKLFVMDRCGGLPCVVYFPVQAPIAPHSLDVFGMMSGNQIRTISTPLVESFEEVLNYASKSDVIVISDREMAVTRTKFPVATCLDSTIDYLLHDDRFKLIKKYKSHEFGNGSFYVFVNLDK
ncbi:hypothetical protein [Desulfovibrio sp.]|uniref:hypothetical protein n=1 Tax=Desulfovibrio sp. TaxID=885 RepID=UPI002611BB97|nr:hypothetical protein [Desulfovibrio sp.]